MGKLNPSTSDTGWYVVNVCAFRREQHNTTAKERRRHPLTIVEILVSVTLECPFCHRNRRDALERDNKNRFLRRI